MGHYMCVLRAKRLIALGSRFRPNWDMLTNEPAGHQWYNGVDMNWQIGARDVGEMLDTIAYRYIGIGLACGYSIHTDTHAGTQEVGTGIGYGTHAAWASAWSASG